MTQPKKDRKVDATNRGPQRHGFVVGVGPTGSGDLGQRPTGHIISDAAPGLAVAHDLLAEANDSADQRLEILAPAAMIDVGDSYGESPDDPGG